MSAEATADTLATLGPSAARRLAQAVRRLPMNAKGGEMASEIESAPKSPTIPMKVSTATRDRVRFGAALYSMSQQEFVDHVVAEFFETRAADIANRARGFMAPNAADD